MVSVTTERPAASRQLGEEQIITNVGAYSKAAGGKKTLGLEMIGNAIRTVKKTQKNLKPKLCSQIWSLFSKQKRRKTVELWTTHLKFNF